MSYKASPAHKEKMARKKADRATRHRWKDNPLRYRAYLDAIEARGKFQKAENARNGVGRPPRNKYEVATNV